MKPLSGLLVVDLSQFLAGPSASLRLADLGARVIKIERPGTGDLCRQLYISNLSLDGDSTLFHSINRNKQSYAADLKNPADLARVRALLARADVMIQNFRPGVIDKIGLGFDAVRALNPRLVYAEVTGYGSTGPWRDKPGQDLLVQSLSGLPYLNGDASQPPVPFGLAVADMFAGAHLVQGILAALVRRGVTNAGARVEVSLLESILEPSKVINEQYQNLSVFLKNGDSFTGRIVRENTEQVILETDPVAGGRETIARGDIDQIVPSKLSPMPEGLANVLTREEILDLLAYIQSGGKPESIAFRQAKQ